MLIDPLCCRASRTMLLVIVANIVLEVRATSGTFSRKWASRNGLAVTRDPFEYYKEEVF
jgi:hypothetical protein